MPVPPPVSSLMKFIGNFDYLPDEGNLGDICVVNGDLFTYFNNKWNEVTVNVDKQEDIISDGVYTIY